MQQCACTVRLRGRLTSTQRRHGGVTMAEIAILRAIHGSDSVVDVKLTMFEKRSAAKELRRLRRFYAGATTEDGVPIVDAVFPGHDPRLPIMPADVGLNNETGAPLGDDAAEAMGAADTDDADELTVYAPPPPPKRGRPPKNPQPEAV